MISVELSGRFKKIVRDAGREDEVSAALRRVTGLTARNTEIVAQSADFSGRLEARPLRQARRPDATVRFIESLPALVAPARNSWSVFRESCAK